MITNIEYNDNIDYSTTSLQLGKTHSMILHHNNLNLNIVSKLNLFPHNNLQKKSIYFSSGDVAYAKIKELLKLYNYSSEQQEFKNDLFLRCSFKCNLRRTILIGEADINQPGEPLTIPIFINDDGTGNFYDIKGRKYLPNHKTRISSILPNVLVHIFISKKDFKNRKLLKHVKEIQEKIKEGYHLTQDEITRYSGIRDQNEEQAMYRLKRIRITPQQIEAIATHFLTYRKIEKLNYDETEVFSQVKKDNTTQLSESLVLENLDKSEKYITPKGVGFDFKKKGEFVSRFQYHTRNKLNFFCIEKIKRMCIDWLTGLNSGNAKFKQDFDMKFKRALFVGFSVPTSLSWLERNAQRRAIYLLADGTFSDGYYNYMPTYETMTIKDTNNQQDPAYKNDKFDVGNLLVKLNQGNNQQIIKYNHNWLLDKQCYLFTYWPYSFTTSLYNQQFRKKLYNNYIFAPLSFVSSVSAVYFAGIAIYGAAFMPIAIGIFTISSAAQVFFYFQKRKNKQESLDIDKIGGKGTKRKKNKKHKNVTTKSKK